MVDSIRRKSVAEAVWGLVASAPLFPIVEDVISPRWLFCVGAGCSAGCFRQSAGCFSGW